MNKYIRQFNEDAYLETDYKCKMAALEMMKPKGYVPTMDVNKDTFQNWDLEFFNEKLNKFIKIENEMRENYELLKGLFPSIHIPVRKQDSPADYYLVWKPDLQEFILIENKFLSSSPLVTVNCKARNGKPAYTEQMVDVPKENVEFYKKVKMKWRKITL